MGTANIQCKSLMSIVKGHRPRIYLILNPGFMQNNFEIKSYLFKWNNLTLMSKSWVCHNGMQHIVLRSWIFMQNIMRKGEKMQKKMFWPGQACTRRSRIITTKTVRTEGKTICLLLLYQQQMYTFLCPAFVMAGISNNCPE